MDSTVDVAIPVSEHAAFQLLQEGEREAAGRLVSRMMERRRRRAAARACGLLVAVATEARANGLTDRIVEQELAAYDAERRS